MRPFLLVLLAVLPAATAQADDPLPPRLPGLWQTSTAGIMGMAPITVKQCIDAKTDGLAQAAVAPGAVCSKREFRKSGDAYEFEANCKINAITVDTKGRITGDFSTRVKVEAVNTLTGIPGMPNGMPPQTLVIESHRTGECEAGQTPGDIILPDGRKLRAPGT